MSEHTTQGARMTGMSRGADLILHGGTVLTMTDEALAGGEAPEPTALAVRAGRIAAIGDDEWVGALGRADTHRIDLAGRLVVPGFIDAHIHPSQGGLERVSCDLTEATTNDAALATVRGYADANPDRPWLTGGGWSMDLFGGAPRREALDSISPDRPVALMSRDHHSLWANTAALRLADLSADTIDPPDGRIERDPNGTPSGTLHEGAMSLVGDLVPHPTQQEVENALLAAQEYLFSLGVTGWQDALLGHYAGVVDAYDAYRSLDTSGRLLARVTGAVWWDRSRGCEQLADILPRWEATRTGDPAARFRVRTVKLMQDGITENQTAGLSRPYLDLCGHPTDNVGLSYLPPDELTRAITAIDAAGLQVHVHAIGDRAVHEAMDAFAAARFVNGERGNRHHIAHLQLVDDADLWRFADLNVTANLQMLWACRLPHMDELNVPVLGDERAERQFPFGGLRQHGARLAAGSDWPVTTPDPLAAIHVAANRVPPGGGFPVLAPKQRIDVLDALRAYTRGSAYVTHDDGAGQLTAGGPATLAVLDRDIRAIPPEEICATRVELTLADGAIVFDRATD